MTHSPINPTNAQATSGFALSKTLLRQALRTNLQRDDHDLALLQKNTETLCRRLADYLSNQNGLWAAFEPLGFEPDIRTALAQANHITWAYPRIEDGSLKFYTVKSRHDLIENEWKILEPDPKTATLVPESDLSGLLIPGLAFDESCNRLGRGKGFYDKTLARIAAGGSANQKQVSKIGIALERQVTSVTLPLEATDIAMNSVITESRFLMGPHERTSP